MMPRFIRITTAVLSADRKFADYLFRVQIKLSKPDSTLVYNNNVVPKEFSKYGIILSKKGMIIPGILPDDLQKIIMAKYNTAENKDTCKRERERNKFVSKMKQLLKENGLSNDILVIVKKCNDYNSIGSSSVIEVVFRRDNDDLVSLRSEKEPHKSGLENEKVWKNWRVSEMDFDEILYFLEKEVHLIEQRKLFADRINHLINITHFAEQRKSENEAWDYSLVELFVYENFNVDISLRLFRRRCKNIFSAHKIIYRKKLYSFSEKDISLLEKEVSKMFIK